MPGEPESKLKADIANYLMGNRKKKPPMKTAKPPTAKSLIATYLHINPDITWPTVKTLLERRGLFDEAESKNDFDTAKFVSDSGRAMRKMADDLMKDPNVKIAVEQEMAMRAAKKAAKKKKP